MAIDTANTVSIYMDLISTLNYIGQSKIRTTVYEYKLEIIIKELINITIIIIKQYLNASVIAI